MMTPSELREYEFKGAGRNAYKSDDVDNFFGEVAVAYEKIFRENAELIKRVGLLADRLEQFKRDEEQIKQAVIGAQKAADIIVKEAEVSVEDTKLEAEAILAAAKGEAEIIKADAEKQAIADSDLLLSIARDKAESIINKAKEEAHSILIEANESAKNTVGAATRTITSESLHYEMLKKEVSEFRASILAQYKAHIEMISKLPELAIEEAEKQKENAEEPSDNVNDDNNIVDEINSVDPDNDIIEFIESSEYEENYDLPEVEGSVDDTEEVVKTTLPYDFFGIENPIEFITDSEEPEEAPGIDFFNKKYASDKEINEFDDGEEELFFKNHYDDEEDDDEEELEDIMISRGFSVNANPVDDVADTEEELTFKPSLDSIETDDDVNEDADRGAGVPKKKFGFFKRK